MAPYVVNRPLALLRLPDGIKSHQRFFQKHAWKGMNRHIEEIADPQDADGEKLLRIADFNGLVALVQSAVLEIHPWGTTTDNWEKPDMITMDLDPGEDVAWSAVITAALRIEGTAGSPRPGGLRQDIRRQGAACGDTACAEGRLGGGEGFCPLAGRKHVG